MRLCKRCRGNPLSEADERAKLRRVIEMADTVWKK
jgi:hypothetical protein